MIKTVPPGASISIDGDATGRRTPAEVALPPARATSVAVALSLRGFCFTLVRIEAIEFIEQPDKMVATIAETLVPEGDVFAEPHAGCPRGFD